jgi:hypothetical protein
MTVQFDPRADNVLRVWEAATPEQRAEGIAWYRHAHGAAASLDPDNPSRAAGVIAALSPQTSWARNLERAARAYADGKATGHMRHALAKANAILNGADPLDVLNGPKERAFYMLIADPNADVVVVDRHAIDIALGQKLPEKVRNQWRLTHANRYQRVVDAFTQAARTIGGITPSQLQAATWTAWRGTPA